MRRHTPAKWISDPFYVQRQSTAPPAQFDENLVPKIHFVIFAGVQVPSGYGSSGSFTWPFPRAHSGEGHQRENASKVATHLAVLEGMDKKTGPRYLPRLNILGCFTPRSRVPNGETAKTDVRHDTTDAHRPLKQSVLPGID